MAESLILPNSTFSANNITTTGNVVISSALYLGTTSLQVSVSTGGVNANVYSGGTLVRQGYAPTYVELSTAPSVAAEGDKWWSTSNSMPFRYLSGGWRKLGVGVVVPLYTFTNATFTPGGATGINGPILSAAKGGLSGTPTPSTWYDNTSFFNMTAQGIQKWTVPITGSYTIVAAGAVGGSASGGGQAPGRGIIITSTVSLTKENVLHIVVGQRGLNDAGYDSAGGGGGTFIATGQGTGPILVAGGGGAATGTNHGSIAGGDGLIGTSGGGGGTDYGNSTYTPGSGGNGATGGSSGYGGGANGGGFYNNGISNQSGSGSGFAQGATGGGGYGGFGGGAAGYSYTNYQGGGGGGYSGGCGALRTGAPVMIASGGGGSYYSTYTSTSYNTGNGYVTITKN